LGEADVLITKGSFFAVQELTCFVTWLMARWKCYQPTFERVAYAASSLSSSSSTPPHKSAVPITSVLLYTQARILQETIMTLLVIFMGGLHHQVLASLCLNNVTWNTDKTQCFLRLTNKKVVLMGTPQMPIASSVPRMLKFFKQCVHHHLLVGKGTVNSYFVNAEGTLLYSTLSLSLSHTHSHTHTHTPNTQSKPKPTRPTV
jgi:hypothetical protein